MTILIIILAGLLALIFVEAGLTWPYESNQELEDIATIAVGAIGVALIILLIALRR